MNNEGRFDTQKTFTITLACGPPYLPPLPKTTVLSEWYKNAGELRRLFLLATVFYPSRSTQKKENAILMNYHQLRACECRLKIKIILIMCRGNISTAESHNGMKFIA